MIMLVYYNAGYDAGDDAGLILPSEDNPEWFSSLCHNLGGYFH